MKSLAHLLPPVYLSSSKWRIFLCTYNQKGILTEYFYICTYAQIWIHIIPHFCVTEIVAYHSTVLCLAFLKYMSKILFDLTVKCYSWFKVNYKPLWKTGGSFLTKLKRELLYSPVILLLGIYPKNIKHRLRECIKG